jgi:prophage DNA circulation protein
MSWRERLLPASFKGARFWVESAGQNWGRRVSVQRFAGAETNLPTDQGREPREFDVAAYLFGDDYDRLRDKLEATLVEGGPGPLVLPTRGSLRVRVTRGPQTFENPKNEGGYCTIRFSVVHEPEQDEGLQVEPDTAGNLRAASGASKAAYVRFFQQSVKTKGQSASQLAYVSRMVEGATRQLQKVTRTMTGVLGPADAMTRDLDAFNQSALTLMAVPARFATTALDLVFTAYQIPETVIAGIDRTAGLPTAVRTAFGVGRAARAMDRAAMAFRGFGEPFMRKGTSSTEQQAVQNAVSVAALVRTGAVAEAATAYVDLPFDSADFALTALGHLLEELDALQKLSPDDGVFTALGDLRAALTSHIYRAAGGIPESVDVRVRRAIPSLLLAHQLYGDARLEPDLVERNNIPDPSRVSGTLSVLRP